MQFSLVIILFKFMDIAELYNRVLQAYLKARKNERNKHSQLTFEINLYQNINNLVTSLCYRNWNPSPLTCFMIEKPTFREIFAPEFKDEVVSHLLFDLIEPEFERKFIYDSFSCRKGKGTLFGINRFIHHIKSVTDNYKKEAYVLNLDISGYFMNIDRLILKEILLKNLKDHEEFDFIKYLINTILDRDPCKNCIRIGNSELWRNFPKHKSLFNSPPNVGLTIGDVVSQLFSNIYLNELDQFCKSKLGCKHYMRYVDDIRILSDNKKELEDLIPKISEFLKTTLHLNLHPKKTKIISTNKTQYFLGAYVEKYRVHANRRTIDNFKTYVKSIKGKLCGEKELSHINAYLGYLQFFDDFKIVNKIIKESDLSRSFIFTKDYSQAILINK